MACPPIITGDQFLLRTIEHIDCQAQMIGSYGYQALGEPGSLAATAMTGLLTIFIAMFALRLMFGPAPGARDLVNDVLKIGIVLTLAFSWPAFRTVIYDVTLNGPAEIASTIQSASQGESATGLPQRLQATDNAIVSLTEAGSGRNTSQFIESDAPGATFEGTALEDENTYGLARLAFLVSVIGILATLRIAAGLLLAIAPLAAGMLLFPATRGLFSGWLKGLVFALLGSVGVTLVLVVELAILQPWLADALRVRELGYATPSAPIELLAITLAFSVAQLLTVWLLARVAFNRGWADLSLWPRWQSSRAWNAANRSNAQLVSAFATNRAEQVSGQIEAVVRREERYSERLNYRTLGGSSSFIQQAAPIYSPDQTPRLGSTYRRTTQRHSSARVRRDSKS